MGEAWSHSDAQSPNLTTLRAAEIAGGQWGVIGHEQLRHCGVGNRAIARWRGIGRLHLVHPGVYAYGHRSIPMEGRMVAALLYAGEAAVLSHVTAAWWWGLVDEPPDRIEVSRVAKARSLPEIMVHHRRRFERTRHRRFPVTTVPQTLLDLAGTTPLNQLRRLLARAEYLELLGFDAVEAMLGQGRSGTCRLRKALARHQPALAATRSRTERMMLSLCENAGLELPEVNVKLHGWTVDFLWREQGLVVETDGYGNHHTPAQIDRDRRKDLALRSAGLTVNRYSRQQVDLDGERVVSDVARTLAALISIPTAPSA
jgi:very-short-patch-repair endonuclease